jgi:hypothetical protein
MEKKKKKKKKKGGGAWCHDLRRATETVEEDVKIAEEATGGARVR